MELKGERKDAKRRKSCSKIKPWSVQNFSFVYVEFFIKVVKNDHGTLVGLTRVKGTAMPLSSPCVGKSSAVAPFVGIQRRCPQSVTPSAALTHVHLFIVTFTIPIPIPSFREMLQRRYTPFRGMLQRRKGTN